VVFISCLCCVAQRTVCMEHLQCGLCLLRAALLLAGGVSWRLNLYIVFVHAGSLITTWLLRAVASSVRLSMRWYACRPHAVCSGSRGANCAPAGPPQASGVPAECVARGRCYDRSLLYSLALRLQTEQKAGPCSSTYPLLVLSIETLVRMDVNKRMHAEPLHPTVASGRSLHAGMPLLAARLQRATCWQATRLSLLTHSRAHRRPARPARRPGEAPAGSDMACVQQGGLDVRVAAGTVFLHVLVWRMLAAPAQGGQPGLRELAPLFSASGHEGSIHRRGPAAGSVRTQSARVQGIRQCCIVDISAGGAVSKQALCGRRALLGGVNSCTQHAACVRRQRRCFARRLVRPAEAGA